MDRKRYITVIKNEKGFAEYDVDDNSGGNTETLVMNQEEFDSLCKNGVFRTMNEKCGLMIDDYESEIIYYKDLNIFKDIIDKSSIKSVLSSAIDSALSYGSESGIALDF